MRRQVMEIRKNKALCIATPAGIIRIRRGEVPHKLLFELPDGIVVDHNEERSVVNSRFFFRNEMGELVPTFRVLTPKIDVNGVLLGVETPRVRQMKVEV